MDCSFLYNKVCWLCTDYGSWVPKQTYHYEHKASKCYLYLKWALPVCSDTPKKISWMAGGITVGVSKVVLGFWRPVSCPVLSQDEIHIQNSSILVSNTSLQISSIKLALSSGNNSQQWTQPSQKQASLDICISLAHSWHVYFQTGFLHSFNWENILITSVCLIHCHGTQ